jgi:ABC-type transport system involved in multi-copper enzyme maturation permease subunit
VRVAAIVAEACRELLYRKTLWVYFGIVTLVLVFFALALRTDVADGVIASLSVMGLEGEGSAGSFRLGGGADGGMGGLTAARFVRGVQLGAAFFLYPLGILLSVFATASLVPRMLERGTIDLLLSKPVTRPTLFASRCLGGLLAAGANLIYLVGGLGAILGLKTGVWNGGFLLSGLVMALYFGCLLCFMALVGVLFRSTTITTMITALVFFVSLLARWPHENRDWPLLITSRLWRFAAQGLVEGLYHLFPRTYEFGQMAASLIMDEGAIAWGPILGSLFSGAAALAAAVLYFARKDF